MRQQVSILGYGYMIGLKIYAQLLTKYDAYHNLCFEYRRSIEKYSAKKVEKDCGNLIPQTQINSNYYCKSRIICQTQRSSQLLPPFLNSCRRFGCIYSQNMSRYIQICDKKYGTEGVLDKLKALKYLCSNDNEKLTKKR
jgi:hypothetical protein